MMISCLIVLGQNNTSSKNIADLSRYLSAMTTLQFWRGSPRRQIKGKQGTLGLEMSDSVWVLRSELLEEQA
jgi:hypothetical protein